MQYNEESNEYRTALRFGTIFELIEYQKFMMRKVSNLNDARSMIAHNGENRFMLYMSAEDFDLMQSLEDGFVLFRLTKTKKITQIKNIFKELFNGI